MDKYDTAIAWLTKHPEEIVDAYCYTGAHAAGYLFDFLGKDSGCPVQVRRGDRVDNAELKSFVMGFDLPYMGLDIKVEQLHMFATIQRKADQLLPERRNGHL